MQRTRLSRIRCSLARSLDVIGEWWTPLILRDLFAGIARFEDLRRDLGVASNVLTDRLATLEAHGIVARRPYQDTPTRSEYVLSEKGRDLFPVLAALLRWGDRWTAGRAGPPALLVHEVCGRPTTARVVCSHCAGDLSDRNVTSVAGPGGRTGAGTAVIGPLLAERARYSHVSAARRTARGAAAAGRRVRPSSSRARRV